MDDILNRTLWDLAQNGLSGLTRHNLAEALDLPLSEVEAQFPNDTDLLLRLIYDLQSEVGKLTFSENDSFQDKVFETIMAYLDILAPYRNAVNRVWRDVWFSPQVLWALKPHHLKITEMILRECGSTSAGLCDPLKSRAYATFFLYIVYTWINDATLDQSKTMVVIDQGLQKLKAWEGYLSG